MSRSADYTIEGFLYQFNKSVVAILDARDDHTITVEGVIEDIEVASPTSVQAIQCKYHEASGSFTESALYKPLLQMLLHFSKHRDADIRYVLFAHFAANGEASPSVGISTLEAALKSKNQTLKKYIKEIPQDLDLGRFVDRFRLECGPNYEELAKEVATKLEENGIPAGDVETLGYPNAIHMVATLSAKHDSKLRRITKGQFVADLKAIRTTAISRWTLALKTRTQLLTARRKQLKVQLDKNVRIRYFVIDPTTIEDYDTEVILFITDFIDKYHFKTAHTNTPLFCLCATWEEVQDLQHRLYAKGVIATDGLIGGQFEPAHLFRDPLTGKKVDGQRQREFAIRILPWKPHGTVLNDRKCDDLFIVGDEACESLDTTDVNVERLAGVTMKELKFILGVTNVFE